MGGKASKISRNIPTRATPGWAGARTDSGALNAANRAASAEKSKAIEMDSMDPHFMAKLNRLGPVKVDHHMQTISTDTNVKNMLRSRDISEEQASSTSATPNRLLAKSLMNVLEERKWLKSREDCIALAGQFGIDVQTLETLSRTVNSPSVAEGSVQRLQSDGGEERTTMLAVWKEPRFSRK